MKRKRSYPDVENVASANECTGLIPALPEDEEELDDQTELEAIHRQKS